MSLGQRGRFRRRNAPPVVDDFARRLAARDRHPLHTFSPDAMTALLAHRWPGNVRELEHVVERALLLCQGDTVAREDLALIVGRSEGEGARFEQMTLDEAERQPMQRALAHSRGQVSDAAKTLGLSRSALYRRLQHHGLKVSE